MVLPLYGAVQMLGVSMFSAHPLLTEWLYAMESGTEGPASLHVIYLSCHLKFKQNDRVKQKSQHHYCSSKYYRWITAAFNMLQSVSKSHNEVSISLSFYVRNHKSRVAHLQLFIEREVKLLKKYRDVGQIQTQERTLLYSSSCHVIAHWSRRELVNVLLSKMKQSRLFIKCAFTLHSCIRQMLLSKATTFKVHIYIVSVLSMTNNIIL